MLKNYLKIALRNLAKNKVYSFINIGGLSVGMAVAMLILLYVIHEISFDKFHSNGDRIYKITANVKYGDQEVNIDRVNAKLAGSIKDNNPEVLAFVRIGSLGEVIFKNAQNPNKKFKEGSFLFVDSSMFSVFSYKLKTGDLKTIFKNPFSLVISENIAQKYFGKENPIGKVLISDAKHAFTITGVMENIPSNATDKFDFVSSLDNYPKLGQQQKDNWEMGGAFETYLLLNSEKSVSKVTKSIIACGKKTGAFDISAVYSLKQFSTQHLAGGFSENTNVRYTYIFAGIALLILFLALFNYMSLTTALATTRAKEVSIRKVVGGDRKGLITQFYVESFLICSIAFCLAFILSQFLIQPFYDMAGVQIDTKFINAPKSVSLIAIFFIFCAFIAGSYPAILLSKFKPIEVIKGKFTSGQGGKTLRKSIIVLQFTVSCVLIICVITTQKQLEFMKNMDLGYTKSQILAVPVDASMAKSFVSLKQNFKQLTGVQSVTSSMTPLYYGVNMWFTKSLKSKKEVSLFSMTTDEHFFKTVDLKWLNPPTNNEWEKKIFVNESAAKQLELGKNPIGKFIDLGNGKIEVGGLLKNFHFFGLKEQIQPLVISTYPENSTAWASVSGNSTIYVRFDKSAILTEKIATIRKIYEQFPSEKPFEYYFLDEAYNKTFATETQLSKMLSLFSSLAIFIACMGLLGLVTFSAQIRTKEIGIRKVLGASVGNITALLSKDFLKLVIISIIIASPIAYYFMNKWLADFAYRVQISWWIFAIAGFLAIAIALLTIGFQSIKSALANPVKSLRTE